MLVGAILLSDERACDGGAPVRISIFETSTEDECDLDPAVKHLEEIAHHLRQLPAAEQDEFRQCAYRAADSHPSPHVAADIRRVADGLLPIDDE
jgi:hypothetical protein